jgi:hypothetical protein
MVVTSHTLLTEFVYDDDTSRLRHIDVFLSPRYTVHVYNMKPMSIGISA